MHQESIILVWREIYLLQGFISSNFSQVRLKLFLPVNLRPKPFSPSRQSVSLPISIFMMYIFPVALSLNLSPIFSMAPSPFLTSWEAIPAPRGPRLRAVTHFGVQARVYPWVNWSSGAGCSPRRGVWSGTTGLPCTITVQGLPVGLHNGLRPKFSLRNPDLSVLPFFPDQRGLA